MAPWGWIAATYGGFLLLAAIGLRGVGRRAVVAAAAAAYALIALGAGTLRGNFWIELLVPGGLLLGGYWLSGFFFRDPQPWLEQWLMGSDRRLFAVTRLDRWLLRSPRWVLELLEASYTADYVVIAAGAFIVAPAGAAAVGWYWTLVLGAELACYGALPLLRSRPPRVLEAPGVIARRAPVLRRVNEAILNRASVQANTLPSGHVAGAVVAALAVMSVSLSTGWILMGVASVIALAAVAGRYHYAVDCVAGAIVAIVVWRLV
jgi:hypothetical protein